MKARLLIILILTAGLACGDVFRVHYSVRGVGRDVTIHADSSSEARRTVMDMFPRSVVTGVRQIRK